MAEMKFKFKVQQYQTDAVEAVVDVFAGQVKRDDNDFLHSRRIVKHGSDTEEMADFFTEESEESVDVIGYSNTPIQLPDSELLQNINRIQDKYSIKRSSQLIKEYKRCALDIEMETGTGKTYVYIKTMFELSKRYGWNKFIVVIPSIAIREGVKKSFQVMEEHFMEQYGRKARYFVYDSDNLNQINNDFATQNTLSVMIINMQAFNTAFKEGANNKASRKMYSRRDDFGSQMPIDVIAQCNPIIILDEPQKMEGPATKKALERFNPLFTLNYSATHRTKHNTVYALDALDAYNKKLVKKIEVKGFELHNLQGIDSYLFLQEVRVFKDKPPVAVVDFEVMQVNGPKRKTTVLHVKDDLYHLSGKMNQYKGYVISEINPYGQGSVTFTNGVTIEGHKVFGDMSEIDKRRIQIRETILAHFEKEEKLFSRGIKTLSLFFIDEVANYRQYDADGNEVLGEYGRIFEEEYNKVFDDMLLSLMDSDYKRYLERVADDVHKVHTGYFSVDKKGKSVDSKKPKKGEESAGDDDAMRAYDLIMKNKERLLSFDEPVRFIFSHSALSEGWDNPNVFQICTLKHANSETRKRQEVGRGMRLCVNQEGNRQDWATLEDSVHDVNLLTVIASESYEKFVSDLQNDMKENLRERPVKVDIDVFKNRIIKTKTKEIKITNEQASQLYLYMASNGYIDNETQKVSDKFREDVENKTLAPVQQPAIKEIQSEVHDFVTALFVDDSMADMIGNANETKVMENKPNDNFYKKEFQALWNKINHKYSYRVSFDSTELIHKSIRYINENLRVAEVKYTLKVGRQQDEIQQRQLESGDTFNVSRSKIHTLKEAHSSSIKYDLLHEISSRTDLTRRTVADVLRGLYTTTLAMFKANPEEFIRKVSTMINEQKANMIVEGVEYDTTNETFDSSIFNADISKIPFSKKFDAKKHVLDYVVTDGLAEKSVERKFAEALDSADEVEVYAKLPRGFYIPTPVGNYSPDWAIAFKEGTVQHIYFVAETKGTNSSLEIKPIEKAKIQCAGKLFAKLSGGEVRYGQVKDYGSLMDIVMGKC